MSKYAIQNEGNYGGDYWEKKWWPSLKHIFPNYEVFWQKFIAKALTNRPTDIRIRDTIDPRLEEMAMVHYSAFYHLGVSNWLIDLDGKIRQQSNEREPSLYSEVLFHLSSATEMIDRFLFAVWKIAVATKDSSDIAPLNEKEVISKIQDYIKSKSYQTGFRKFKGRGQPVGAPLHNIEEIHDLLSKLMKQPDEWSGVYHEFRNLADQEIKAYRNNLAHNPIQGTIELNHEKLIPKPKKLFEYALWRNVFKGKEEDFMSVDLCINDLLTRLCRFSDRIWARMIDLMESISGNASYQGLLNQGRSEKVLVRASSESSKTTIQTVTSSDSIITRQETHIISGTNIRSSNQNDINQNDK